MIITIVETNETFNSYEEVAKRLGLSTKYIEMCLSHNKKAKGYTLVKEKLVSEKTIECDKWKKQFDEDWEKVCESLRNSKKDLSKINLVCCVR